MLNLSTFAERLKEYMQDENLNETQLAQAIGFDRVTVCSLLNKAHAPSTKIVKALIGHFNCSADYLLGRSEFPQKTEFKPVKPIGKMIRQCLNQTHLSEYRLQKDLNVSSSLTYRWLHDKAEPSVESLFKLAKYFDCTIDYLLGRE